MKKKEIFMLYLYTYEYMYTYHKEIQKGDT